MSLQNPSFEIGGTFGWAGQAGGVPSLEEADAIDGANSMKVVCPGSVGDEGAYATAKIPANPNQLHTASAWVKAAAGVDLHLNINSYEDASYLTTHVGPAVEMTGAWQKIEFSFTTHADANAIEFYVLTSGAQAVTFWTDALGLAVGGPTVGLPDLRALIRADLHDEDASAYRWENDTLDRHIEHALDELSRAIPLESISTLETTPGSRELDLSGLDDLIAVDAIEYPVSQWPVSWAPFAIYGSTAFLQVDPAPATVVDTRVHYQRAHAVDASSTTLPPYLHNTLARGAAGLAATEWASYAINRVNIGGNSVAEHYANWGKARLDDFRYQLERIGRRRRVHTSRTFTPTNPLGGSQAIVTGPGPY